MEMEITSPSVPTSKEHSCKSVIENWLFFKYIFKKKKVDFNRIKLFLNNLF